MRFPPSLDGTVRRSNPGRALWFTRQLCLCLPFLLLWTGGLLPAQETAPAAPLLRIDGGMHLEGIISLGLDREGGIALTVSRKSARLWSIEPAGPEPAPSQAPVVVPLRQLHAPLEPGGEVSLTCGALSGDARLVALGVVPFQGGVSGERFLCVLDAASGRLRWRQDQLPEVAALQFSPDGAHLAAAFYGGGVRVWSVADARLVGEDKDYQAHARDLAWRDDGHFAAAGYDGQVRLYEVEGNSGLRRVAVAQVSGGDGKGRQPRSVAFSPDGNRLALGFFDVKKVEVRDGSDLSLLRTLSLEGQQGHTPYSDVVAWTVDGGLATTGSLWPGIVRIWEKGGEGPPRDMDRRRFVDHHHYVTRLAARPGGGFLYAASDPSLGILDLSPETPRGEEMTDLVRSPVSDYNRMAEPLRILADGTTLDLAYTYDVNLRTVFSLDGGGFRPRRAPREFVSEPWIRAEDDKRGLPLNLYQGRAAKNQFAGKPLPLDEREVVHRVMVARDASFFVMGTSRNLRRFDAKGQPVWKLPSSAVVLEVNLREDDQVIVAVRDDGTIRWHRADTGAELLALFLHVDQKRWVAWTPGGYYTASPGGEDLIGWLAARGGNEAADYYPASRFRAVFYRPDVVRQVLRTLDPAEALRLANASLGRPEPPPEALAAVLDRLSPPVVELETGGVAGRVEVEAGTPSVRLRYAVRGGGSTPPRSVELRFDGRPLPVEAPLPAPGEMAEVEVPLPPGLSGTLSVIARHDLAASEAAFLRVARPGAAPDLPNLRVIATGVSKLRSNTALDTNGDGHVTHAEFLAKHTDQDLFLPDLEGATADARRLAALFQAGEGRAFSRVTTTVVTDGEATTQGLRDLLADTAARSQPGEVVVFSFAGHGYADDKHEFFLATHDVTPDSPVETGLTGRELVTLLDKIPARVVLLLDTCQSGAVLGRQEGAPVITGPDDLTGLVNTLSSAERGIVVLNSSAEKEFSFESEEGGYFTLAVGEGLQGGAALPGSGAQEGRVTCGSLGDFVARRVPAMLKGDIGKIPGATEADVQTPSFVLPVGAPDFILARPRLPAKP